MRYVTLTNSTTTARLILKFCLKIWIKLNEESLQKPISAVILRQTVFMGLNQKVRLCFLMLKSTLFQCGHITRLPLSFLCTFCVTMWPHCCVIKHCFKQTEPWWPHSLACHSMATSNAGGLGFDPGRSHLFWAEKIGLKVGIFGLELFYPEMFPHRITNLDFGWGGLQLQFVTYISLHGIKGCLYHFAPKKCFRN